MAKYAPGWLFNFLVILCSIFITLPIGEGLNLDPWYTALLGSGVIMFIMIITHDQWGGQK